MVRAYHASKAPIQSFSLDYLGSGKGHDESGPGIYFSNDKDDAQKYGSIIYEVEIDLGGMREASDDLARHEKRKIARILIEASPFLEEKLKNFDDGFNDKNRAIRIAADTYASSSPNLVYLLSGLRHGWYGNRLGPTKKFIDVCVKTLGINGLIRKEQTVTHYIVYNLDNILHSRQLTESLTTIGVPGTDTRFGGNTQEPIYDLDDNEIWQSESDWFLKTVDMHGYKQIDKKLSKKYANDVNTEVNFETFDQGSKDYLKLLDMLGKRHHFLTSREFDTSVAESMSPNTFKTEDNLPDSSYGDEGYYWAPRVMKNFDRALELEQENERESESLMKSIGRKVGNAKQKLYVMNKMKEYINLKTR